MRQAGRSKRQSGTIKAMNPFQTTRGGAALCVLLVAAALGGCTDRKSVVEGKRLDLGGRRVIKKKKNQ